jgi:hypothetical protein
LKKENKEFICSYIGDIGFYAIRNRAKGYIAI